MQRKLLLIGLFFLLSIVVEAQRHQQYDPLSNKYEQTAAALFNRGEDGKALAVLTKALKSYPEHPGLNYLMGKYYYHKNEYSRARFYFVRTIRYENDNMAALGLLTNIEERTGNYSSAICYINEMLIQTPYNKALWLRKIGLYHKQDNNIEAERLLKRLAQIFPNDNDIRRRYQGQLEENVKKLRSNGRPSQAVDALRQLVERNPHNISYYLELVNLLIQSGRSDEALNATSQGLYFNPGSASLIQKKASILAEMHRYGEANDCLRDFLKHHSSAKLSAMQRDIEEETARDAVANDPYEMYKKVYDRTHSADAFHFLLNTSISRGYFNDALYYIGIARKSRPNDPQLLWKEYTIYQQIGNKRQAKSILEKVVRLQPRNSDAIEALSTYDMDDATDLMASMDYQEAVPLLDFVIRNSKDKNQVLAALNKKYTCLFETKQYTEAEKLLAQIERRFPNYRNLYLRQADLLVAQNRYQEALAMLGNILNKDLGSDRRAYYLSEYEDIAVKYIKQLEDEGATRKALDVADSLVQVYPSSKLGLLYAINNSALLNDSTKFDKYSQQAASYYPQDVNFKIKLATSYQRQQKYDEARGILQPYLYDYPNNKSLIGAYSENSRLLAESYVHSHQAHKAVGILDSALVYDGGNRSLLYDKGLASEAKHEYDSAHYYEKFYQPGILEAKSFGIHLDQLLQKSNRHFITVNYVTSRYGDNDTKTSVAGIEYAQKTHKNTYSLQVNYAGRDGNSQPNTDSYSPGGTGIQVQGQWDHTINDYWSFMGNAAVSTKYFPRLAFNLQIEKILSNDWTADVHAGYRNINSYSYTFGYDEDYHTWSPNGWKKSDNNMFNLGIGLQKSWASFTLGGKADAIDYASHFRYSAVVNGYYYPLESRILTLSTMASVSNAPQTEILDAAVPGTFDKTNTTVGAGITYQLIRNVSFSLNGTWSTFPNTLAHRNAIPDNTGGTPTYDKNNYKDTYESKYKNLFSIDGSLTIGF